MKRAAVISAILENPDTCQNEFNSVVSAFNGIIKGRMGIPMPENNMAVICLVVTGTMDDINSFTGRLGNINNVNVKTTVSKKEISDES